MRRADYMASIVKQVGKLSTDALRYLDQWSFPWGVIPILKAYDEGELLRRVDCDMEVALAMEEIVRCRDCIYFDKYENDEISVCYRFDNEQPIVEPDGFCAWARRKSEE